MARTKDEIFDELILLKDANAVLAAICTSNSKASFYQSLFTLFSDVAGDFELTFDAFVETMDALLVSKQVHTDTWWRLMSLEFQLGDSLSTMPNGNLYYPIIDESKQIVKRSAVRTSGNGLITLLIAKLDTDGITPIPLLQSEKIAFDGYVDEREPAGIVPTTLSVDGDEIKTSLSVIVDTQIIDITDGTLLSDGVTKPVEDAIFAYFANFQDDDFGGVFYGNNMMNEIVDALGVTTATYDTLTKQASNESVFSDVLALPNRSFSTFSGYVKLATGYDLSANITYE